MARRSSRHAGTFTRWAVVSLVLWFIIFIKMLLSPVADDYCGWAVPACAAQLLILWSRTRPQGRTLHWVGLGVIMLLPALSSGAAMWQLHKDQVTLSNMLEHMARAALTVNITWLILMATIYFMVSPSPRERRRFQVASSVALAGSTVTLVYGLHMYPKDAIWLLGALTLAIPTIPLAAEQRSPSLTPRS